MNPLAGGRCCTQRIQHPPATAPRMLIQEWCAENSPDGRRRVAVEDANESQPKRGR